MYKVNTRFQIIRALGDLTPPAALASLWLICRAYQLGSLRERLPFPKKPRCQSIVAPAPVFEFATQIERVAASSRPSTQGLSIRRGDSPKIPIKLAAYLCEKDLSLLL